MDRSRGHIQVPVAARAGLVGMEPGSYRLFMNPDTIAKLAIAEQFSHNAQYAGVPRQAAADGYSAIDALFSAILADEGVKPPRNHKEKLDTVRARVPHIFDTHREQRGSSFTYMGGIPWDEIELFYREWLASRYDEFDMTAGKARERVAMMLSANTFVIRWLAEKHGEEWIEVLAEVSRAAYGYAHSETSSALSDAHDRLFSEAEQLGERVGRKLGIKMASTTNFCGADIVAGDDLTRQIIEEDRAIAEHASAVYVDFCRLMDRIRSQRAERIRTDSPGMDHGSAFDLATDFMLSMKAKYHGERLSDTGARLGEMLSQAMQRTFEQAPPDTDAAEE
ncbi:hypothetical protein [Sphingomonas echinoides]|jgi:hypothetical protein|uniref:hypothetical protein n=1 Tax=Sphingomonas echinoides TaxID=59803 RepID=UPI003EEBECD2